MRFQTIISVITILGTSAGRKKNNIRLIQTIQLGAKPLIEETKFPNIKSAFYGYDLVIGDPTALSPLQQGYTNDIFDVHFERSVNFNNTDVKKALSCDVTFKATLVSTGESYIKSVISTSEEGSNFQYGNQVQVEIPVEGAKVSATFPPPYQSSASNSQTMSHFTSALNTNLFTMAKTKAECYRYLVQIKSAQHPPFTKQFVKTAIDYEFCMIENKKHEDKMKCAKKFLENYGTHYIKSAGMGSSITFTRMYQKSHTQKMTEEDKKKCAVHNTKVDLLIISFGSDSTTCKDDHSEYSSFSTHSVEKTRMVTRGSTPDKSMADWAKQGGSPEIIQMILSPISNLFTTDFFKKNELLNLKLVKKWLEHDLANYCEIFKAEYRCKYVTRWNFTTPATCKIYPSLTGIWTGPLDSDVLPNGMGTFWTTVAQEQKLSNTPVPFDHGCPSLQFLPGVLLKGEKLGAGNVLNLTNGEFSLMMQTDGNLVVYKNSNIAPICSSKTVSATLYFKEDGNLEVVQENSTKITWSSGTNGTNAKYLILQDDGNLVLYTNDFSVVWSTGKPQSIQVLLGGRGKGDSFLDSSELISDFGVCTSPRNIPQLPVKIIKGQSAWSKDTLIFCGGVHPGQLINNASDQCWSIPPGKTAWSSTYLCGTSGCGHQHRNNMTSARCGYSLTTLNNSPGEVLAVGGFDHNGNALKSMELYSFAKQTWTELDLQLPKPRSGHCTIKISEKSVIIIGGGTSSAYPTDTVLQIDFEKGTIAKLASLPYALWMPACTTQNGNIYVSGGFTTGYGVSLFVYTYSFDDNKWSIQGTLNHRRYGHTMGTTSQDQMVVAGGTDIDADFLSSIEESYTNGQTWTTRSQSLGEARFYSAMAQIPAI